MISISIKPRQFDELKDKRAFTQISASPTYWQSFHQAAKSYRRHVRRKAPDMRKDNRLVREIFKATTEKPKHEMEARA